MARLNAANNAQSLLNGDITDVDTALTVLDGSVFPDAPFLVTIGDEIIQVGAKSGNTFSDLLRGQEGTTAAAHADAVAVENRMTAGMYNALATQEEVDAHKAEDMTQKTVHGLRYEEGSWTPTLFGQITAGAHTYSAQVGRYIRIGKKVTLYGSLTLSAKDPNMDGNVRLGGLPFIAATAVSSVAFGFISNLDFGADGKMLVGYAVSNRCDLAFVRDDTGANSLQPAQIRDNTSIIFTVEYYIN